MKRLPLFENGFDYSAFEQLLFDAKQKVPVRLLAYCIMPNHWHLILEPIEDDSLSRFMHWLTVTHAQRWHAYRATSGTGAVYQGRYKAIPVQSDSHFLAVCRYVERNALRANLVADATEWRWSSLWRRVHHCDFTFLDPWPTPCPRNWVATVNEPQTEGELAAIRQAIGKGSPIGEASWICDVARDLWLESSLRGRGRPSKEKDSRPLFDLADEHGA